MCVERNYTLRGGGDMFGLWGYYYILVDSQNNVNYTEIQDQIVYRSEAKFKNKQEFYYLEK